MRGTSLVVFLTAVLATSAHAAQPVVPVTACGDVIPAKSRGVLAADLDCTGFAGHAVTVGSKATFDLQGFTLTGGQIGVFCNDTCEVVNGTVTAADSSGVLGHRPTVRNLTVTNNGTEGVQGIDRARAFDATISGNGGHGIKAWLVQVERCTITGNAEHGVSAGKYSEGKYYRGAKVKYSTVTGNGTNPDCNTSVSTPCADIASGRRPKLKETTCDTTWAPQGAPGCSAFHWCLCSIN